MSLSRTVKAMSFCFTGSIKYTRDEVDKKLDAKGGWMTENIRNANYLVIGTRPGAKKLKDAKYWNVKQISEGEFLMILGENTFESPKIKDTHAISIIENNKYIQLFMNKMENILITNTDLAEDVIRDYIARAEAKTILELHREMRNG